MGLSRLSLIIIVLLTLLSVVTYIGYKSYGQHRNPFKGKQGKSKQQIFLTEEEAKFRSSVINAPVLYDLIYDLQKGDQFAGTVIIKFELAKVVPGLFLDFEAGDIIKYEINQKIVDSKVNYDGIKLKLPKCKLVQGQNEVKIQFSRKYNKDGNGLHSFIDTDQKQYIYSNSEPWHANKFIPSFDQPNLRSIFTVVAVAPSDWVVLSNEKVDTKDHITTFLQSKNETLQKQINLVKELKSNTQKDENVWIFKQTQKLSTYFFFLGAGPYKQIKATPEQLHQNIPMSLYCRQSLYDYLRKDAEEIFSITTESMKFYEKFFGQSYKYSKYDQIFCPEYNPGAMENPGAVTFNDIYIFREEVVPDRRIGRANTIAHELCHMWFGDFVTMQWWNDLWLNESFADFFSYLALSKIKVKGLQTHRAWIQFNQRKVSGYSADQFKTTHPIAGVVQNTEKAETIFDGITYSKGASSLKQIYHLVGEENLSEALQYYFDKFGWKTATLNDFLGSIQKVLQSKFDIKSNPHLDLDLWSREWLQKAGLNEVTVQWNPQDNSAESKLQLVQSFVLPVYDTLRYHKLKIAFVDVNGKIYDVKDVILQNQKVTEVKYDGSKKPVAIIPNYADEAFIKVIIDNETSKFMKVNLNKIEDTLTRLMVWKALSEQATDARISSLDFIQTVLNNFEQEEDLTILETILVQAQKVIGEYIPFNLEKKLNLKGQLFQKVKDLLMKKKPENKYIQIILRDKLIAFANSNEDTKFLLNWFTGKIEELQYIELTPVTKWSLIRIVSRNKQISIGAKKQLIEQQYQADPSDQGKLYVKLINGLIATGEEKKQIWQSFLDKNTTESVRQLEYFMQGFNDISNIEENQVYFEYFFKNVVSIFEQRTKIYANSFWTYLFPPTDNLEQLLVQVQKLVAVCPKDQTWFLKRLTEKQDILEKRLKAFELVRRQ